MFLYILTSFSCDARWPENSKFPTFDFGLVTLIIKEAQRSTGNPPKKARSDGNTGPGETSAQEETPSEPGVGKPNEAETKEPNRPQKQALRVQSAIYASHKISSPFNISHTINLTFVGTRFGLKWDSR